jgi:hypothetical protein
MTSLRGHSRTLAHLSAATASYSSMNQPMASRDV